MSQEMDGRISRLEWLINNRDNEMRSLRGQLDDLKKDLEQLKNQTTIHHHYHYPSGWHYHPWVVTCGTYSGTDIKWQTSSLTSECNKTR